MNVLPFPKRAMIVRALCDGNSIRGASRIVQADKNTVMWLGRVLSELGLTAGRMSGDDGPWTSQIRSRHSPVTQAHRTLRRSPCETRPPPAMLHPHLGFRIVQRRAMSLDGHCWGFGNLRRTRQSPSSWGTP